MADLISDDLRADLCKVWILGFLDAMAFAPPRLSGTMPPCSPTMPPASQEHAPLPQETRPPSSQEHAPIFRNMPPYALDGRPVTAEDYIPSDMVAPLIQMAESSIDGSTSMIAELYRENPQTVYDTLYSVGYDLCMALNVALGPIEVNLN